MRVRVLLFVLLVTASCKARFDRNDFDGSRKKVEADLDTVARVNLEKALRVVALEAMRLKWDSREEYKDKSFNAVSLELVDGLTYTSVVNLAEDILKKNNSREIEKATTEIVRLNNLKDTFQITQRRLDLFEISSLRINNVNFLISWFQSWR